MYVTDACLASRERGTRHTWAPSSNQSSMVHQNGAPKSPSQVRWSNAPRQLPPQETFTRARPSHRAEERKEKSHHTHDTKLQYFFHVAARRTFNVDPDTHIDSIEQAKQVTIEGTSKWSCKIAITGLRWSFAATNRTLATLTLLDRLFACTLFNSCF